MQATISTKTLKHAAVIGRETVWRDSKIRDYGYGGWVRVHVENGTATLSGSDMDSDCFVTMPATDTLSGLMTMQADTFHKAVMAAAKSKAPAVRIANGGDVATIGAITMPCDAPADDKIVTPTPLEEQAPAEATIIMGQQGLFDMLTAVRSAVSTEETRYYLNGVYLQCHNGQLRAVATDGHRLATYDSRLKVEWPEHWDNPTIDGGSRVNVIVPAKLVDLILRTLKASTREERATIELTISRITVTMGATVIAGKLIDGTYPDYQRVGGGGTITMAGFDLATIGATIKAASLERGESKVVLRREGCEIRTGAGGSTRHALAGVTWDAPAIAFNPTHIRDIAQSYGDRATEVDVSMADGPDKLGATSPALITAPGSGLRWVLMPLRID